MPAVSAGTCDPIEASLRSSLEGASSGSYLDDQLISSAKKVLLTKIEYHPAEKEYTSALKSLQAKYIHLNSNAERPEGSLNHIEEHHGSSSLNGSHEDCRLDADGIPVPRVIIHSSDNIKLGWLRVYKIGAGLANLGNTCFLNATLQCLTYTPPLVNHLIEFNEHSSTCKNVSFCMMCELQRHIRRALEKNGEIIRPQCILQKLKSIAAHMTWGRQEDAHEFLHYMMESMISSSLNGYSTAKLDRISYETTVVNQIFGGYHRSQVICLRCKEKSDTYDHFMDIMLDIKNVPSLEKALEHFVQPEVLDNENAYMCPHCKQKCPAKKRFTIHRAPNITTFQLKRFDYSRSMGGKITKHISFPEKFDMRAYMSQRQGPPITYLLYAVLVHQGVSCNSGHYFCFVRNSNNLWYLMDDSKVRQVSVNVVLSQQAYLLFYTRIPNSGQFLKSPLQLPTANNRLPLTPVSSSPSVVANNGATNNIINGIAGKQLNDSFGVPLVRKSNILNSSLVKPKSVLTNAVNTANTKPPSLQSSGLSTTPLPTNREKITFDFKLANNHHAQNSSGKPSSSATVADCSSHSSGNSAESSQPKHPRIVMHIKNGKVYNYHQQQSRDVSSPATEAATTSKSALAPSQSSLVPYAPDSSEESDQDSGKQNPSSSKCGGAVLTTKHTSKCDTKERTHSSCKVKLDPQLNATTKVPGLPKLKVLEDRSILRDCSLEGPLIGGRSPKRDEKMQISTAGSKKSVSMPEGQLSVITNCASSTKVNATSQWAVLEGSQQSPSVISESSSTSTNSTSGWVVVENDKDSSSCKIDRAYQKWTVTSTDDSLSNVIGGIGGASSTKKISLSEEGDKTSESDLKHRISVSSPDCISSKSKRLHETHPDGVACSVAEESQKCHSSRKQADSYSSHSGLSSSGELKLIIANIAKVSESVSARRTNTLPTGGNISSELQSKLDLSVGFEDSSCGRHDAHSSNSNKNNTSTDEFTIKVKPPSEYKWMNGAKVVETDAVVGQRYYLSDNQLDHKCDKSRVNDRLPSECSEGLRDVTAPVVNGNGQGSESSDEQMVKRHKRKKKHWKERDAIDDETKWKKKFGKKKESPELSSKDECSGCGMQSRKKKRHSSSGSSSSSGGYELEWVEKTKETLEEESKTKSQDPLQNSGEDKFGAPKRQCDDSLIKNGDVLKPPPSVEASGISSTVTELLKKGGRGYGDGVSAWDGSKSLVNVDAGQESCFDWKQRYSDSYNDMYDRGKVKRVKNPRRYSSPNFVTNPFQRVQDMKVSGGYFKQTRCHFNPHSPYQWDGHYRGSHMNSQHYSRGGSRNRYFFHHNKR